LEGSPVLATTGDCGHPKGPCMHVFVCMFTFAMQQEEEHPHAGCASHPTPYIGTQNARGHRHGECPNRRRRHQECQRQTSEGLVVLGALVACVDARYVSAKGRQGHRPLSVFVVHVPLWCAPHAPAWNRGSVCPSMVLRPFFCVSETVQGDSRSSRVCCAPAPLGCPRPPTNRSDPHTSTQCFHICEQRPLPIAREKALRPRDDLAPGPTGPRPKSVASQFPKPSARADPRHPPAHLPVA
jgi:hypothetical protein